ncbi:glycosyltransferase [Hyphomonas sp.]|uniref:glycosyltransferase n=1 Tax=Hyphomonas sp. TaxID=87 RepID=UPI001BCEC1AC|nr:glycosyltransferase [Hyphomonas sp.]
MRIGLRLFYNPGWMGGVNYVLNIARMLRSLPPEEQPEIIFLTTAPQSEEIAHAHTSLADAIAPFASTRQLGLDFVYPATQLPEAPFGAPWAGWIPDWQCQYHPDMFPEEERARRYLQYREIARRPVACIFSSQQAIDDTRKLLSEAQATFWDVFHFPAVFDEETWLRPEVDIAETRKKFSVPAKYLIVCNQFWRHKNHLAVAEALSRVPELDAHVVMTGALEDSRWPDYAQQVEDLLKQPDVARRVTLTGRISRDEQLNLLLGASGYIQPSLFEGWSTFVEEARALGLPGLLSDIPVHREQSPEGGIFFDPHDAGALASSLSAFWGSSPLRPSLTYARQKHQAYTLSAARKFMSIAHRARQAYRSELHDSSAILAKAIPDLFDEIGQNPRFARSDFDRWLANARLLLREHPEDLARIAAHVCNDGSAFSKETETLLVKATLGKCTPDIRERFAAFNASLENLENTAELQNLQKKLANPHEKALMGFLHLAFRVGDKFGRLVRLGGKRK